MKQELAVVNNAPPPPTEHLPPREWAHAVVITELHCRRCGYDLRSLSAEGRCPECGLEIWQSVQHTVDPAASRLPQLRNPRAVGDGLLALTIGMLVGTLLLAARPLAIEIDSLDPRGVLNVSQYVPRSFSWGSLTIGLLGLWAVLRLAPPRGKEPSGAVWMDMWFILVGFVGWSISATLLGDAMERGIAGRYV